MLIDCIDTNFIFVALRKYNIEVPYEFHCLDSSEFPFH